jgi:hypothetical protein
MKPDKLQEAQLNQQAITNDHLDALHTLSGELNDKIDKLNKGLTDHKIEVNVPEFKDFPEIKLPEIKIPEIKIPKIEIPKIPEPKITIKPNITVEPTPVKFPKEMEVKGLGKIVDAINDKSPREGISKGDPLPIMVVDSRGNQINEFGGSFSAPNIVGIKIGDKVLSYDNPIPTTSAGNSLTLRLAESGVYTYIGEAVIGGSESDNAWRIKRIDETSGMSILWADGNSNFDNVWSNYLTLTYL